MGFNRKSITTSVGYSFAFAAICSMALSPSHALAVDDAEDANAGAGANDAIASDQATNAPVASEKNETVYLYANPDGSVKNVEVTEVLTNPNGEIELADSSILTDIENTASDSYFNGSGKNMVWDAAGENVNYKGNTTKEAPVSIKISYFLDGKKVSPDSLVGASGHLKIRFDYDNKATKKAEIRGKTETLYVPFTFITAILFDNENFKNAKVVNGKLIEDGDRTIVAGYAMPGLSKSLGKLVDDFDIPEHFEVEADVTDFEMKSSLTIATSGLLEDFNADDLDTSELEDASEELSNAMGEIIDGASLLKGGLDRLAAGAKSASVASGQIAAGGDTLAKGANALYAGVGDADDSAKDKTLIGGMNDLKNGYDKELLNPVKAATTKISKFISENETNIAVAWEALQGMDKTIDAVGKAVEALGKVDKNDLGELSAQLTDLQEKLNAAKASIAEAQGMIDTLSKLDLSAVEGGLTAVGSDIEDAGKEMQSAGENVNSAATTLLGESMDGSGGTAATIAAAGDDIKAAAEGVQGLGAYASKLPPEDQAAFAGELEAIGGNLQNAGGALGGVQGDFQAVGGELQGAGSSMQAAGEKLASAGDALKQVGTSLNALKDSLPNEEKINEIRTLLDSADGALTNENLEIMNECIDSLNKALGKLDIDELNGEVALLKEQYPKVTKYIESTTAKKAMKELQTKMDTTVDGLEKLSEGLASEQEGLKELGKGASDLAEGTDTLANGLHDFDDGLGQLADGTSAAADGTGELVDGLNTFNDEGIGKISDVIDDDILPFKDRLDALSKAGSNYNNFAGITKGTKGSVKFIFETDPIEKPEE